MLFAGLIAVIGCGEKPQPKPGSDTAPEGARGRTVEGAPAKEGAEPGRVAVVKLPDDATSIERLLPEGTIAYFSVDDPLRARADIMKTALGEMLSEEEVLTFLGKPLGQLVKVMQQAEKIYGVSFDDIRKAFGGQVSAALVKLGPGARREPDYAVLAAARLTDADAAGRVFDWVAGMVTSRMPLDAVRTIGAAGWRGIALPAGRSAEVALGIGHRLAVVTIANPGDDTLDRFMAAASRAPARSLALSAEYTHVVSRLGAERIWTSFLSGDGLREALLAIGRKDDPEETRIAERVIDKLGLATVHGIGASWVAEAPGIMQRTYVHAPAPRKGLMALVPEEPLGERTIRLAPTEALSFTAGSISFGKILGLARDVAEAVGEKEGFDRGLAEVSASLGLDIEKDIIKNLGSDIAMVVFPADVGGGNPLFAGLGGISLVLEVKDAAAIGRAVDKALAMADGMLRMQEAGSIAELDYKGVRLRYARLLGGMIAPTVCLSGDRLIVTGGIPAAKELVRLTVENPEPLSKNAEFKELLAHIGGKIGPSLTYSDTKGAATALTSYAGLLGAMMPALSSARGVARGAKCASNLKQIGFGCHLWSSDHDERFPKSIEGLFPEYISDRNVFACPTSPAAMSYVFVSGLTAADPADWIVAYDRPGNHGDEGVNVLYIGGNVAMRTDLAVVERQVAKQVAQAKGRGRGLVIVTPRAPAAGQAAPPAKEMEWGELQDWVDFALLPSPRSLTRHLFPQIGTTIMDEDGVLGCAYGPLGGFGLPSLTSTGSVAVIAAIAIPNLMVSRIASNESVAIASLRMYLGAQNVFHRSDFYGKGALVYANPKDGKGFPDLYQVPGKGERIMLVDLTFARATYDGVPKAGYVFSDLEYDDYAIECGLCAVPAAYNRTARNIFIVDVTGTVYQRDAASVYPDLTTGEKVKPLKKYPSADDLTKWIPVGGM